MKPCSNYRKRIALLVLRALDSREERDVCAHLEMCPGCRLYFEGISGVWDKLSACKINPGIHASEAFHRKLAQRLKAEGRPSRWAVVAAQLQAALPKWKIALPVIGAAAAIVAALLLAVRPPVGSSPLPSPSSLKSEPAMLPQRDLPPTISNYQMVANRSLEKFDELLAIEGNRNPPPAPVYTASSLSRAILSD